MDQTHEDLPQAMTSGQLFSLCNLWSSKTKLLKSAYLQCSDAQWSNVCVSTNRECLCHVFDIAYAILKLTQFSLESSFVSLYLRVVLTTPLLKTLRLHLTGIWYILVLKCPLSIYYLVCVRSILCFSWEAIFHHPIIGSNVSTTIAATSTKSVQWKSTCQLAWKKEYIIWMEEVNKSCILLYTIIKNLSTYAQVQSTRAWLLRLMSLPPLILANAPSTAAVVPKVQHEPQSSWSVKWSIKSLLSKLKGKWTFESLSYSI